MKIVSKVILLILPMIFFYIGCENREKPAYASEQMTEKKSEPAAGSQETLLTVDGQPITEKDLDQSTRELFSFAKAELYDKQKKALDNFLFTKLANLEAEKKKMTTDALLQKEVDGKKKKITQREIKRFYDEATKGAPPGRVPPLDKVSDRIRQKLEEDALEERRGAFFAELTRKHKVEFKISRPEVNISGVKPVRGQENAPVTIVEFSDYECPYCRKAVPAVEEVLKKYKGKVNFYYRDFPLSMHPNAKPAALAASCANDQGKFWEFHDKLFAGELGPQKFENYAKEVGMNLDEYKSCFSSKKFEGQIEQEMNAGEMLGVRGTPAFFINGTFLSGAPTYDEFKKVIDKELTQKRRKS